MLALFYTLTSENKNQNKRYQRLVSMLKYFVLITTLASIGGSLYFTYFSGQRVCVTVNGISKYVLQFNTTINIIIVALIEYRMLLEILSIFIFIKLFDFFFTLKKAKLAKERKQFKTHQIVITVFIWLVVFLNLLAFFVRGLAPLTQPFNQ